MLTRLQCTAINRMLIPYSSSAKEETEDNVQLLVSVLLKWHRSAAHHPLRTISTRQCKSVNMLSHRRENPVLLVTDWPPNLNFGLWGCTQLWYGMDAGFSVLVSRKLRGYRHHEGRPSRPSSPSTIGKSPGLTRVRACTDKDVNMSKEYSGLYSTCTSCMYIGASFSERGQ